MDTSDSQPPAPEILPGGKSPIGWKPLLFGVAAIAIVMAYAYFHQELTLHALAHREDQLREYQAAHPVRLPLILFAIYVVGTGISLPVGIILSIGCGWLFGQWEGTVLVSFAATTGATVGFLISRYLLRDAVYGHFAHLMTSVDELVDRDGAYYLLSLRLVHIIPSWLINLLMGWTTIRMGTFWWATQLGTLPATIFYVYMGQQYKSLQHDLADKGGISRLLTPVNVAVFVLLATVPLVARQVIIARGRGSGVRGQGKGNEEAGK